jgi:hypothetical protein
MATKKKSAKSKKTAVKKPKPAMKQEKKGRNPKKSPSAVMPSKAVAKTKHPRKAGSKTKPWQSKRNRNKRAGRPDSASLGGVRGPDSGGQSGDLQGLSDLATANSESVDELIEEGNAFEAGVLSGVEEAEERGEKEVHTREVPEDDVPGEYLDEE